MRQGITRLATKGNVLRTTPNEANGVQRQLTAVKNFHEPPAQHMAGKTQLARLRDRPVRRAPHGLDAGLQPRHLEKPAFAANDSIGPLWR